MSEGSSALAIPLLLLSLLLLLITALLLLLLMLSLLLLLIVPSPEVPVALLRLLPSPDELGVRERFLAPALFGGVPEPPRSRKD